jgi:hypothetical protein
MEKWCQFIFLLWARNSAKNELTPFFLLTHLPAQDTFLRTRLEQGSLRNMRLFIIPSGVTPPSGESEATDIMDSPEAVTDAVNTARQFFQEGHRTWARPMVNVLEDMQPKLALRWAVLVYQQSISTRCNSGSESQLREWLDDLTVLIDRDDVADHCDRVAYESWRNDPTVNLVERGIARLYWSRANQLNSRIQDYYMQVAAAVGMLADNENTADAMDEATLELAIDLFRRMVKNADKK